MAALPMGAGPAPPLPSLPPPLLPPMPPLAHTKLLLHAYSARFSPFPHPDGHRVALAAAQHYGIIGNGALYIMNISEKGVGNDLPLITRLVYIGFYYSSIFQVSS